MTTYASEKIKCSICGAVNEYSVLMSTNSFGSPDLDLRPPEMKRSTIGTWVQECPRCGYVAHRVDDDSSVDIEWIKSDDYFTCNGISFISDLAKRFYRHYMISIRDNKKEDACFALIHAAWACDDTGDRTNAVTCRKMAVPLIGQLIDNNHKNKENLRLMKADLLRRSCQFEKMIKEYSDVTFDEDIMNKVLAFEVEKAKKKDGECYTVRDVLG